MDNLIISLNTVLPVFLMMATGYFFRRVKLMSEDLVFKCNSLVFKLFLPCMFFSNIYSADVRSVFNGRLVAFNLIALFAVLIVSTLFVCLIRKDNKRRGAMIQALFRSNYVILGVPLIFALFGDAGVATESLIAAFYVPFLNMFAVVILELFRGGKVKPFKILLSVVKNPLIIAAVLALILKLTGISLPSPVFSAVKSFGNVATPLSLLSLGAFFKFSGLKHDAADVLITSIGRLIVVPLFVCAAAYKLGFRGAEFASTLIAFGAPVAVMSFPMAQQMDSDYTLAGELVVVQSAISCLTLFFWIFLYKQLGAM